MYLCPDMEYLLRRRNPQVYCSAGTSTNWGRKFFWTIGLGEERGDKVINERARPKSRTCGSGCREATTTMAAYSTWASVWEASTDVSGSPDNILNAVVPFADWGGE